MPYLLAAVFFLVAAAAYAALPPNGFIDNEVRLEQDHQLYGQPFNNEAADKVVVTDEDRSTDAAWERLERPPGSTWLSVMAASPKLYPPEPHFAYLAELPR
jgi:hypothetical protein